MLNGADTCIRSLSFVLYHIPEKKQAFCKKHAVHFCGSTAPAFFPVCRIHCTKTAEITGGKCYAKKELPAPTGHHNLILEDRSKLTLTGVTDVDCFDERMINLFTGLGS